MPRSTTAVTAPRPPRSALIALYMALSRRGARPARWLLQRRQADGKEHVARIGERMGVAGQHRPEGQLAWFHAASVGEAASLLELLRRLREGRATMTCLITSGTVTSAQFVASRMPEGCLHQFVPLDVQPWIKDFLDHWQPDLAVWTESELWPAMLVETSRRGIPMLLINARISSASARRWRLLGRAPRALLRRFDRILAQDAQAATRFAALGANSDSLTVTGSLKEGAAPLPFDEAERNRIAAAINGRPLWLAASTHTGEEDIVVEAHVAARKAQPGLQLILAPRHPDRGDGLAAMLRKAGLNTAQRSKGEEITSETDVYLADTLGELGLWYRIAPVSFVGGSLVAVGGHNPFEPALLGSAILHGPHVHNFADAYRRLTAEGGAVEVRDAKDLAETLIATMAPDRAAEMAAGGWAACSEGADVTDAVIEAISAYLDRPV